MIAQRPWYPEIDPVLEAELAAEGVRLFGCVEADGFRREDRELEAEYQRWIAAGYHGSMAFLEQHGTMKYRADNILPGCRSIVFVGLNYYQRRPDPSPRPSGRVARYAWGRDYHKELGNRLRRVARRLGDRFPEDRFRPFTDSTPLAERAYAERAGVGFTGRHTLLINGAYGSWFVVGEILSTRRFAPSEQPQGRHGACPRTCRRCIDVCPTGALLGPHRIDASRCISYLTIEHAGSIPEELRPLIGEWLFGCDLCQEVCPLNVRAQETDVSGFTAPIAGSDVDLAEVLEIRTDEDFVARFAGSPLMRARRRKLVRNACIVAANIGARELLPRIDGLVDDEDPIVREHARWAAGRLRGVA